MPGSGLWLVVRREAVRQSRRRRTWGARLAYTAVLLGAVLVTAALVVRGATDVSQLGRAGTWLFACYGVVQLLLVAGLAPVLVASGVVEEKEERTLEMLVISRLSAGHILWGKVGNRLLTLLTLVLGGLPVLAVVLSLGGVSPWQVINLTSSTALIAVLLGTVAGFVALFTDGPRVPVAAALIFGATIVVGATLPLDRWFNPVLAGFSDDPRGLLAWLPWLPVLLQIGELGAPVLRIVTTDDSEEEFGLLSPDVWVLERFQRRTALSWVCVFVGGITMVLAFEFVGSVLPHPALRVVVEGAGAVWAVTLLFALSTSYLLATLRGVMAWQRHRKRVGRARVQRAENEGRSRRVWNNPVLWREVSGSLPRPTTALGAVGVFGIITAVWVLTTGETPVPLATMLLVLTLVATPPLAAAPALEQRRRRTLPLLLITPMSTWRIAWAKTLGPVVRVLPVVAAAFALWLWFTPSPWFDAPPLPLGASAGYYDVDAPAHRYHLLGPNIGRGHLLRVLATAWWYGTLLVLLAALAVATASAVRTRSFVWPLVIGGTVTWAVAPLGISGIADAVDLAPPTWLLDVWFPLTAGSMPGFACELGGAPRWLLLLGAAQLLVAVLAMGATAWVLARQRWHAGR